MSIRIGTKKNHTTIYFQERGLRIEQAKEIWIRLDPKQIKESCKETGTCLISWKDGLASEVRRTKDGYTIWCGEEI